MYNTFHTGDRQMGAGITATTSNSEARTQARVPPIMNNKPRIRKGTIAEQRCKLLMEGHESCQTYPYGLEACTKGFCHEIFDLHRHLI